MYSTAGTRGGRSICCFVSMQKQEVNNTNESKKLNGTKLEEDNRKNQKRCKKVQNEFRIIKIAGKHKTSC